MKQHGSKKTEILQSNTMETVNYQNHQSSEQPKPSVVGLTRRYKIARLTIFMGSHLSLGANQKPSISPEAYINTFY